MTMIGRFKLNNVYNEDCYKAIKDIPDKSIDLIITDPPYLMESGGSGKKEMALRFHKRYTELKGLKLDVGMGMSFLAELERVCKYIYIYIWCNKNLLFDLIAYYHQRNDVNLDIITWGKTNPMPLSNNHFLNDTEYCLCIHEKGVGWNKNAGAKVKRKCYMTSINMEDKNQYLHPNCKPIDILTNFILNSSEENDIVFDPFCGSGSTLIAAKRLNRKYIGFEIENKWYQVAKDRLQGINQKGELNLFDIDYD